MPSKRPGTERGSGTERDASNSDRGGLPKGLDPKTTSPVLLVLARGLAMDPSKKVAQRLEQLLPRLKGTSGDGQDAARGLLAVDWLLRELTPLWVEQVGLLSEARALRALPPIRDGTSADRANEEVARALTAVQADAQKAAEQLQAPLASASTPEAGEAWNGAAERVEGVAKGSILVVLEHAAGEAARRGAEEVTERAGWNWAVSVCDMAAQSVAWRGAMEAIAEAVATASRGEEWNGRADEAKEAASEALAPSLAKVSDRALGLLERMIAPK